MKQKNLYNKLIGKSREEVIEELGEGFNYYQSEVWTYNLKKDWLGRWIYLYLCFHDNKVSRTTVGRRYQNKK